jgi:hypothetical protein
MGERKAKSSKLRAPAGQRFASCAAAPVTSHRHFLRAQTADVARSAIAARVTRPADRAAWPRAASAPAERNDVRPQAA